MLRNWRIGVGLVVAVLLLIPSGAVATEMVEAGHWSYSTLNKFIGLGLVNGYNRGFMVSNVDRLTMAKYVSLIFDGKSESEILEKGVINEADLSVLADLVNEYIQELSTYYPSRLGVLLEKSMNIKEALTRKSFGTRSSIASESSAAPAVSTPSESISGRDDGKTSSESSAGSIGEGVDGEAAGTGVSDIAGSSEGSVRAGTTPETTDIGGELGDEWAYDDIDWYMSAEKSVTVRSVNTNNSYGYELLNAEKKAGLKADAYYFIRNEKVDGDDNTLLDERMSFELKNSDLYDYLIHYDCVEKGEMHWLGKKLRPDFTEYTLRAKEITGYHGVLKLDRQILSLVSGTFLPDDTGASRTNMFLLTDRYEQNDRTIWRLTYVGAEGHENKLGSLELKYKLTDELLFENEVLKSKYAGTDGRALESRVKYKHKKASWNFKYKSISDRFMNLLSSTHNYKVRLSDLDKMEGSLDYRFTPFITTLMNAATYKQDNWGAATPYRTKTIDFSDMIIYAVPRRPKLMAYYKLLDKIDDEGQNREDNTLKLTILSASYDFGKFEPRIGRNVIDYLDRVNAIDYVTTVNSFGFDQRMSEDTLLRVDYTTTDTVGTINTSIEQKKLELRHAFDDMRAIGLEYTNEKTTGDDRRSKKILTAKYNYKLSETRAWNFTAETIDYIDELTTNNTFDSNELGLKYTIKF